MHCATDEPTVFNGFDHVPESVTLGPAETGSGNLSERHIESALDEMLFSGGELNSKLFGMERTSEQPISAFVIGRGIEKITLPIID